MGIEFTGRLRWYGKQGRLEIYYDEVKNAWYASIKIHVSVEETKTGKKSKHIIHGERKSIKVVSPKGSKVASIDLGINVLASILVNDGSWVLYKGIRTKEDYFYFQGVFLEFNHSLMRLKTWENMRLMLNSVRRRGGFSRSL